MPSSSIIRTALDALGAKQSALAVGYKNIIPEHEDMYRELLNLMSSSSPLNKRQSPLVNAGYAVRLAVVSTTVHSFLKYHQHEHQPVQLVILGCGMDVLGLWAARLSNDDVTVYELDTPEIVNAKRDLLLQHQLVVESSSSSDDSDDDKTTNAVLEGHIVGSASSSSNNSSSNYFLFDCDLRKIPDVASCLETVVDTTSKKPTLVLSELVLTYLGRQPMDDLLSWVSDNLCHSSTMVAFEPLGPKPRAIRYDILEGYKHTYCQKFVEKLSKGMAHFDPDCLFSPLGVDTTSVESRFLQCGFQTPMAVLAGHAMASMVQQLSPPEEPFDEYMALDLHLQSYALVVGFGRNRHVDCKLIRYLCPWSNVAKHEFEAVQQDDNYTIRQVQAQDQEQVRELYRETYQHLFDEYPSVRKMVKTGLKTDLKCRDNENERDNFSSIGARFGLAGGVFLVATVDDDDDERESSSSLLLGCVGLRLAQCQQHQPASGNDTTTTTTFEIHRLSVDPASRGKGVGRTLLTMMEKFAATEVLSSFRLTASTPAILTAANNLYTTSGFELVREETLGKMVINTYSKTITAPTFNE